MKTIKREGLDVGTAFSSTSKRMQSNCSGLPEEPQLLDTPEQALRKDESVEPQPAENFQPPAEQSSFYRDSFKAKIKRVLRLIAKHTYRILKPLIKPIAFRAREYFIAGFSTQSLGIARQQQAAMDEFLLKIEAIKHQSAMDELLLKIKALENPSAVAGLHLKIEALEHQTAMDALLLKIGALEHKTAMDGLIQKIEVLENSAAMDQLILKIEELEQHVASVAASQRLAAEHPQQLVPAELVQQINRIEEYTYASARRVAVNCGSDEIMIRSEIGFVLCSADDHALIATLLEAGELEPGTRQLIRKTLKPGDTYIDVGANIGMHMLAAAQAMNGSGKIIGFEPFGPTKALIDKTMWINGFSGITETHQMAVSNKSGSQLLNLGATSGHHSLFKLDTPAALAKPPVQVELISLDEIIKPNQVAHLLKIDAEGAELEVIEGAKRLLKDNPQIKLIVELGLSHLERTGHTIEDWLEKFSNLGFDYQVINANSGELETHSVEELKIAGAVNLFFSKTQTI